MTIVGKSDNDDGPRERKKERARERGRRETARERRGKLDRHTVESKSRGREGNIAFLSTIRRSLLFSLLSFFLSYVAVRVSRFARWLLTDLSEVAAGANTVAPVT